MTKNTKTKGRVIDYDKIVGIRLRALRQLHKYTQSMLARKLDITFQQVQKYEQGTNRISAGKLKQIIDLFDVSPDYFFDEYKELNKVGFAESKQEAFKGKSKRPRQHVDIFKSTEAIKLLQVYYSVPDPKTRKDMFKMLKTYAENINSASKAD